MKALVLEEYNRLIYKDVVKPAGVSCKEFRRDGAFAQFVTIPGHILYRIPDNVSFEQAAMVEPVAIALHAINLSGVKINDTAVVFGSGMIGLFIIQLLKQAGCNVIAVDVLQGKLDLAKNAGASVILNAQTDDVPGEIRKLTQNRGADFAFEAVGIIPTIKSAIESLRKGATLILVGNLSPSVELPLQKVVTREITVKGSCAINGEYPAVLDLISKRKINVDRIEGRKPMVTGEEGRVTVEIFTAIYRSQRDGKAVKFPLIPEYDRLDYDGRI
jgi:L-iditol 2-dehydrogenase